MTLLLYQVHAKSLKLKGLTTVKFSKLLGSHYHPGSGEPFKCSESIQDTTDKAEAGPLPNCSDRLGDCTLRESRQYISFLDMHQIGMTMDEQLQTVDF